MQNVTFSVLKSSLLEIDKIMKKTLREAMETFAGLADLDAWRDSVDEQNVKSYNLALARVGKVERARDDYNAIVRTLTEVIGNYEAEKEQRDKILELEEELYMLGIDAAGNSANTAQNKWRYRALKVMESTDQSNR